MSLWTTINDCADKLPKGYVVKVCVENGSAWVELYNDQNEEINLPDSTDKNLQFQVLDALVTAKECI